MYCALFPSTCFMSIGCSVKVFNEEDVGLCLALAYFRQGVVTILFECLVTFVVNGSTDKYLLHTNTSSIAE